MTNLESENKVLRQQALAMAQNTKMQSVRSRSVIQVFSDHISFFLDIKLYQLFIPVFFTDGRELRAQKVLVVP